MNFQLREYQVSAVEALRQCLRRGLSRLILSSPTGSGKTEMGFEMIRGARAKGKRVGFVANRVHLVDQTCRRLDRAGFSHGIIQGANTRNHDSDVLVCSIQTLASRGIPEDVDLWVVDEAHACAGTAAYKKLMGLGKPVIGLTATPYSKGLGRHFGELGGPLFQEMVVAARILDLIDQGFLVSADVWAPAEPDLSDVHTVAGDYHEGELGVAMDKTTLIGDIVSHWFKLACDSPTVVFATNISHSKHIVDQFRSSGVKAEHIDCYTSDAERVAILERVTRGETTVISNVGILAEGWDFPACKTLILARPTKSLIRYLQMAGRVLRPYEGKDRATILDHSGTVRRLGFPWDDFGHALDIGNPKKSPSAKKKQEALPSPCPNCSWMRPPHTVKCISCGFETRKPHDVVTADGQLVQLAGVRRGIKGLEDIGRTAVYHQLRYLQRQRGKPDSWSAAKFKAAFGCWPNGISRDEEPPCSVVLDWERSNRIAYAKSKARRAA